LVQISILQLLLNGAFTASIYILSTTGFALVYSLERFPNIAHVQFFTLGAYAGLLAVNSLKAGFGGALLLGFLLSGLFAFISYYLIFRTLKERGAGLVHLIVASVGYGTVLMYSLQQLFGRDIHIIQFPFYPIEIGSVRFTLLWVYTILFAATSSILLHLFLTKTRVGKAVRALANNPRLAMASGIDANRIAGVVWFIGGALAGVGGVLQGMNIRVVPTLGFELLVPTIAVAVLGGLGNFYGVLGAAFVLGFAENFSVPFLLSLGIPTDLRFVIGYVIVVAVLVRASTAKPVRLRVVGVLRQRIYG
jgi:branched-subunit amino acid ABC-type transport system permease component